MKNAKKLFRTTPLRMVTARAVVTILWFSSSAPVFAQGSANLLNVSYDPTRELYKDYNAAFALVVKTIAKWKARQERAAEIAGDGETIQ